MNEHNTTPEQDMVYEPVLHSDRPVEELNNYEIRQMGADAELKTVLEAASAARRILRHCTNQTLTWKPLNPPDPDDFLLVDEDGYAYAHIEQMDEDHWWGTCYVMDEMEDPNFIGDRAYEKAKQYCEGMTEAWFTIRRMSELPVLDPHCYTILPPTPPILKNNKEEHQNSTARQ